MSPPQVPAEAAGRPELRCGLDAGGLELTLLVRDLRLLLQRLTHPLIEDFLQHWPASMSPAREQPHTRVAATRWLAKSRGCTAAFAEDFVARLVAASGQLAWTQSYGARTAEAVFLENYAYCELLGSAGPVACARLAAGVLLLGPGTDYPSHSHEADEIYVPLAGSARWWHGVQPWEIRQPGEVIHHPSWEPHAMRAGTSPLLALYLWYSEDLAQKSQFVSASPR